MSGQSAWDNDGWRAIEIGRQENMARDLNTIAQGIHRAPSFESQLATARREGLRAGRLEMSSAEKQHAMAQAILWIGPFASMLAWALIAFTFGWTGTTAMLVGYPVTTVIVLSLMYIFWPTID